MRGTKGPGISSFSKAQYILADWQKLSDKSADLAMIKKISQLRLRVQIRSFVVKHFMMGEHLLILTIFGRDQWRNQDFFQGGLRILYFPKISRFQKPLYKIFHTN